MLFESMEIDVAGAVFDADAVRALLRAMPPGVLRLKGLVQTDGLGRSEVQFAGKHGSVRRRAGPPAVDTQEALIAIGLRGTLPRRALEAAWHACRVGVTATATGTGTNDRHALALPEMAAAGVP